MEKISLRADFGVIYLFVFLSQEHHDLLLCHWGARSTRPTLQAEYLNKLPSEFLLTVSPPFSISCLIFSLHRTLKQLSFLSFQPVTDFFSSFAPLYFPLYHLVPFTPPPPSPSPPQWQQRLQCSPAGRTASLRGEDEWRWRSCPQI